MFAPREIEMLLSPAYRVLSLSGHRVLSRIEIELAHHAGMDNGALPCTYEHFVEYGIERHSIGPAIRELVALGFIEVTERGAGGNADFRRPSRYRLTYRHTDKHEPTHEWKLVKSEAEAKKARSSVREKTKDRCGKPSPKPVGEILIESPTFPVRETPTTAVGKTPTTSISRGGAGNLAPDSSPSPPAAPRAGERTGGPQMPRAEGNDREQVFRPGTEAGGMEILNEPLSRVIANLRERR